MLFRLFYVLPLLALVGCSNPGTKCFDRVKDDINDPTTAKILNYDVFPMMGAEITRVSIRASNGTGSYENVYGMCKAGAHKVTRNRLAFLPGDEGWTTE